MFLRFQVNLNLRDFLKMYFDFVFFTAHSQKYIISFVCLNLHLGDVTCDVLLNKKRQQISAVRAKTASLHVASPPAGPHLSGARRVVSPSFRSRPAVSLSSAD